MKREINEDTLNIVAQVAEKNQRGLEALASEKIASNRRNESTLSKVKRKGRKALGRRKSGAQKINLK